MTNEQIVMNTRVMLMRNGQIGTTGRKIEYVDKDGVVSEINEPAEIHTYVGWKRLGYQVPEGTKAKVFIPIWVYNTDEEGNTIMMNVNRPFFLPSQVQKIEEENLSKARMA